MTLSCERTSDNNLIVGFKCKGGLGDILISLNYIHEFRKQVGYKHVVIDVYAHRNLALVEALIPKNSFIDNIYVDEDIADNGDDRYDLFVMLNRFPDVRRRREEKIYRYAPVLINFIQACEKFRIENLRFFDYLPLCDGIANDISIIQKKKRIQQPDIFNLFNISEDFRYELEIAPESMSFLRQMGLKENEYITIHRGTDDRQVKNSTKLWPFTSYQILIDLIKKNFPTVKIVQVGINKERCPAFANIDVSLVGKTSIEDMKAILKYSKFHIDNEGGNVHLRHALNGGISAVIYGPTAPEFYGYSENINLRGNGCKYPCEWVINNWQANCARGFESENLPCMNSLTPEIVFNNIKKVLEDC